MRDNLPFIWERSPQEWLDSMVRFSGLADCKPAFVATAEYIRSLEQALKLALNFIENTESELGITLASGEVARNALARYKTEGKRHAS